MHGRRLAPPARCDTREYMPPGPPIGEREREILTAIVETFIATGEPVGSRTRTRATWSSRILRRGGFRVLTPIVIMLSSLRARRGFRMTMRTLFRSRFTEF